ncbi:Cell division cycle protein 27 [Fasciola gigantica]|uniref:Cell division cycle protein 27 homolog n=1 Tax=Fasciola gigantica TaxID=46835 RepID=A0A504YLM6_FASGI|nr:Cell division cycle protein 27 [Fasciola gigantica]
MVRELSIVSDPVMLHVWSCLHNYAYEDALFAAERLYAETNSSESMYLLATSLYRIGRPKQVSRLLSSANPLTQKSRYLLAKCYFDFGLLTEAEESLLGPSLTQKSLEDFSSAYEDQAPYAVLLLGDINRRQSRMSEAAKCYKKCLELNPLMWSAFKNLCAIGEFPNPSSVFQIPEGSCLPTPTYKVLYQTLEPVVISDAYNTLLRQTQESKDKLETICSRENVNPDKPPNEVAHFGAVPAGLLQEKPVPEIADNGVTHRTYMTHCVQNTTQNSSDIHEPMDFMQTPQFNPPISLESKAPRPEVEPRTVGRLLFSDNVSSTDLPTPVSPKFGALAMLSQSPMFACVPVFHKPSTYPGACDSILSNSMRFGTNQCAPLRQSAFNETIPTAVSQGRNTVHSSVNSTLTRLRPRPADSDINVLGPRYPHMSSAPQGTRTNSEQTTTSTPAYSVSSLRRLVIATSPSATGLDSGMSGSTLHSTPSQREPPMLRSGGQRAASSGSSSVLTSRSVPLSSPPGTSVGSSATARASPQGHPQRLSVDPLMTEDSPSVGPRTRSQVAAAAAVARASGIQRRSTRLVRNKVTVKKPECKRTDSQDSPGTGFSRSNSDNTDHLSDMLSQESVSFGNIVQDRDMVTIDVPVSNKNDPRVDSLNSYLELLRDLGSAYQLLVQHQWKLATRILAKLPAAQLATGRILSWAACAHMDNADYLTAHELFAEARRLEPWQLCGMEFYSTVLWQLQADGELAELAQDLLGLDRNAPEPWCAAGNCFSLQGEHETAIHFFRRGLQVRLFVLITIVCPTSAYTYTLLGHEHSVLEEFDRALIAFRHALRLDPRQYNALFGISNVYYKQEKFELAEAHLARAVALFSHSPLLLTNLGALRGRLGRLDDGPGSALHLVTLACKLQPKNPLARYHRASILFHLGRYKAVLNELQQLLILTPREAMVYLMIGHTYKKLGDTPQAMIHYSWAMGLDPKGANTHLRDIMTNPPVAVNRSTTRRGNNTPESAGPDSAAATRPGRVTRSRVLGMPDNVSSSNLTTSANDGDEQDPYGLSAFIRLLGYEPSQYLDEGGMLSATNMNSGSPSSHVSGVRHLTDFSLLYNTEEYDEDAALSGAEDDHYETMELSGDVDDTGVPNPSDT